MIRDGHPLKRWTSSSNKHGFAGTHVHRTSLDWLEGRGTNQILPQKGGFQSPEQDPGTLHSDVPQPSHGPELRTTVRPPPLRTLAIGVRSASPPRPRAAGRTRTSPGRDLLPAAWPPARTEGRSRRRAGVGVKERKGIQDRKDRPPDHAWDWVVDDH